MVILYLPHLLLRGKASPQKRVIGLQGTKGGEGFHQQQNKPQTLVFFDTTRSKHAKSAAALREKAGILQRDVL